MRPWKDYAKAIGKALAYAVVSAAVLLAIVIALSGPSQRERRDTAKNVAKLVAEARTNRELVCIGILGDLENPVRDQARVRELCADVGVEWEG